MSRREELEKELEITQIQLNNIPEDTPEEVLEELKKEYDSISFELNNLYDDDENMDS